MLRRTFVASLLALPLLPACGRGKKAEPLPRGSAVIAFGDSVTHGSGAAAGEDWPSRLAEATGWQIRNAGVPGDTAQAARERLPQVLAGERPALVIIELGGNDFLRRRPQPAVKEDLRHLIRMAAASGARVVLVAVPELSLLGVVSGRPSDSPIYRELGKEEKVPVIADVFSDILARPEWCADKIHPNAEGYRQMAGGIHQALKKLGWA